MKRFHIEGWQIGDEPLGKGCSGEVFRARREGDKGKYIAKRYNPMSIDRKLMAEMLEKQMQAPEHPGIVTLVECHLDAPPYYTISRYETGKRLADGIDFDDSQACDLISNLAAAVGHAHCHGFAHGNFHPGNVFYSIGDDLSFQVKIGDFAAGMIGNVHYIDLEETAYYSSPEQLLCLGAEYQGGNAEKWDVYRFGAVAFWILNRDYPRGESYRKNRADELSKSGGRPVPVDPFAVADTISREPDLKWTDDEHPLRPVIEKCLSIDPAKRPADIQVVQREIKDVLTPAESPQIEVEKAAEPEPEPVPEPVTHEEKAPPVRPRMTRKKLIKWFRSGGKVQQTEKGHSWKVR